MVAAALAFAFYRLPRQNGNIRSGPTSFASPFVTKLQWSHHSAVKIRHLTYYYDINYRIKIRVAFLTLPHTILRGSAQTKCGSLPGRAPRWHFIFPADFQKLGARTVPTFPCNATKEKSNHLSWKASSHCKAAYKWLLCRIIVKDLIISPLPHTLGPAPSYETSPCFPVTFPSPNINVYKKLRGLIVLRSLVVTGDQEAKKKQWWAGN